MQSRFPRCLPAAATYGLREQKRRLRRPRHDDGGDLGDVDPFEEQFAVDKDVELAEPECLDDRGPLAHREFAVHTRGVDAGPSKARGHRIAVRHVRGEHKSAGLRRRAICRVASTTMRLRSDVLIARASARSS